MTTNQATDSTKLNDADRNHVIGTIRNYCSDKVADAVAALLAADGWQPIETAPKDGTPIILCREDRVTAGHWEPEKWPSKPEYHSTTGEYLGQFETGECYPAWWYSEDGGFEDDYPPTHWMPLPEPPQ